MEALESVAQYGALGIVTAALLRWGYVVTSRAQIQSEAQQEWVRTVLVALIQDCKAVLVRVDEALKSAPCGEDGSVSKPRAK